MIYILSYIPFVRAAGGDFLPTVIASQQHMFSYHAELEATHPFSSDWWEWPLIIRPIFYYVSTVEPGIRRGISSFGNPAVWWMGIAATFYAISVVIKERGKNRDVNFLLIAYAAQFVPWIFVSRATFIYHYFPSVPFVVLLIAFFFRNHVRNNKITLGYGAVVYLLFMLFYPVLSATPVSVEFVERFLRWFPAWVLI